MAAISRWSLYGVLPPIAVVIAAAAFVASAEIRPQTVSNPRSADAVQPAYETLPRDENRHGAATVHYDVLAKLLADDRRSAPPDAWLAELNNPRAPVRVESQAWALLGRPAPDFTLLDHRGAAWKLGDATRRGPVVVVFYLGYACDACVHGLCELNADLERFRYFGAQVVAISADPSETTRKRFAEFGVFDFPVLSDPGHFVAREYGACELVAAPMSGSPIISAPEKPLHATFVISPQSTVVWAYRGDAPFVGNMALLHEVSQFEDRRIQEGQFQANSLGQQGLAPGQLTPPVLGEPAVRFADPAEGDSR